MSNIVYDTIGGKIHLSLPIHSLSSRDKCQLLIALMEDLGLMQAIRLEPDSCGRFQGLWLEMIERNWNEK